MLCKWQKFFYYQKGKKVKGLARIKGKTYYFDSKGVQHTGWQKIDGSYYFFQNANGKKGSMDASSIVNGMTLGADGKAVVNRGSKEKLEILVMANEIVEKARKKEGALAYKFPWREIDESRITVIGFETKKLSFTID